MALYLKLIVMLALSSIALDHINTTFWVMFTVFAGELCLLFIKIIKAEMGGTVFQKLLGYILAILLLLVGWYIE